MEAAQDLTPTELSDFLLAVAPVRPVFVWGAPGIGKSALVERFAADVGMDCVSLLGSQLAPRTSSACRASRAACRASAPRPRSRGPSRSCCSSTS